MPHSQRFSIAGRRALITGSSQGIGLALARGLAEAGAAVILNGRDEKKLAAAVATLRAEGHAAESAGFDVTNATAIESAVAGLLSGGRAIDILVNNAGIQIRAPCCRCRRRTGKKSSIPISAAPSSSRGPSCRA